MRFLESILYRDGMYHNLELHKQRLNKTFEQFMPDLPAHELKVLLPKLQMDGTYKVRMTYDIDEEDANYGLEYIAYQPKEIGSLQIVETGPFDYSYKYENRTLINALGKTSEADDIIICIDGNITDGSYSNLVFWDGREWFTSTTPLLNGVRRQALLLQQKIKEAPITINDVGAFQKVSMINAMLDLGEMELSISQVLK